MSMDKRRKALEDEYFKRQEAKTQPDQIKEKPTLANRIEFANKNRHETPKVNHGSMMGYVYAIKSILFAIAGITAAIIIALA